MRFAILTDGFNHKSNSPMFTLYNMTENLVARGHEVVRLNCDDARLDNGTLKYKNFSCGEPLNAYLSWIPSRDFGQINRIGQSQKISYLEQNRILSELYPSPTPYKAQLIVNNKMNMAELFQSCALPIPRTLNGANHDNRRKVINECTETGRTFVLKPFLGSGGRNVYKLENPDDLKTVMTEFDDFDMPFLIQDYIESHGTDYRAFVINDKVVGSIKRKAAYGDWRGNGARGSTSSPFTFTPEQQADAVRAMQAASLRFGAVDILIDPANGRHYICEINDSAGTHNFKNFDEKPDINKLVIDMIERAYG